jgi:hypothetical protein
MKIKYEQFTNISNQEYLLKTDENGVQSWVPCDPANSDYQAYLNKDKAEQSTPLTYEPAEPVV